MNWYQRLSKKHRRTLWRILASAVLLALAQGLRAGGVLPDVWYLTLPVFLIPYLLVGWDVLRRAALNIAHGQLLDENFLMCIATVGALTIAEYPEAVFVMLFYQVGELFQSIAVERSRRSIAALMDIRPDEARVLRGGAETVVSPDEVAVGEIIVIRPGEKVPLDGVVTEGSSELNTLSLTGEAAPRDVSVGEEVISGCVNISGLLHVRVSKPFGESTVAKILELVENSTLVKSRTENAITKFARVYTPAVVACAALLALVPSLVTGDWQRWVYTALIFLVVSCPCALVISVPLSYFGGLGAASKNGILIKGANYLEALVSPDTVAFDKTGTLTQGCFRVTAVRPQGIAADELLTLAAAAEQHSNHPIALSLREAAAAAAAGTPAGAARPAPAPLPSPEAVEELPGLGVRATVGGRQLLVGNARLMESQGLDCPAPEGIGTVVYVAQDGRSLGSILISDQLKPTAKQAVEGLKACGVRRLVMLTGDRAEAAEAIAGELGLTGYRAGLLPGDKVAETEALLKEKRGTLVFVGDGVNDAPVLARADVGVAMGALGSDAAIEAADVVLMDDNPQGLVRAVRIARRTRTIVWQNIWFALGVKLLFLALSTVGLTNMWAATFADVGVAVLAILNAMRAGQAG